MKAGIYARISLDAAGDGMGVARQEELCRALADRKGWEVVELYVDNDVSASSTKERPEYTRMLSDLEAGTISAVVVYAIDRLTRRPMELETFIDLTERLNVSLANVAGEIDLATPMGQAQARMMGLVARLEAQSIGKRVRDRSCNAPCRASPTRAGIGCTATTRTGRRSPMRPPSSARCSRGEHEASRQPPLRET
ncbi:hypothetical protein GCM10025786_33600 [Nocardioides caeni]|uniref:Recombinase family protein n=1 Tax=Nocardioides caeni TaxID=574700 RepID=A0A4V4HKX8_9ACTN|nr:recombinase family protein [Nocardioides caeni]